MSRTKYIVSCKELVVSKSGERVSLEEGTVFYGARFSQAPGVSVYTGEDPATVDLDTRPSDADTGTFTVADGGSTTSAIQTSGKTVLGVVNPAAFTGSPTKWLVLVCLTEGGTYQPLVIADGSAVYAAAVAGKSSLVSVTTGVKGWPWVKLQVVDSSDDAVVQTTGFTGSVLLGQALPV